MKMMIKMLLTLAFVFSAGQASAQLAGWSATVVAEDSAGNTHFSHVSGPTWPDCESERSSTVSTYNALGYTILNPGICAPVIVNILDLHELLKPREIRWPIPGPVCLSCPLFTLENIQRIYPDDVKYVNALVERYRVQEYNKALVELQNKFNVQGFEKEIFELERRLQH